MQGRENEVVIFSAARSNSFGGVGFSGDNRRVNVLLTRARRGFISIGNAETLRNGSPLWKRWLDHIPNSRVDIGHLERMASGTKAKVRGSDKTPTKNSGGGRRSAHSSPSIGTMSSDPSRGRTGAAMSAGPLSSGMYLRNEEQAQVRGSRGPQGCGKRDEKSGCRGRAGRGGRNGGGQRVSGETSRLPGGGPDVGDGRREQRGLRRGRNIERGRERNAGSGRG